MKVVIHSETRIYFVRKQISILEKDFERNINNCYTVEEMDQLVELYRKVLKEINNQ